MLLSPVRLVFELCALPALAYWGATVGARFAGPDRLGQIMRGWAYDFRYAVCKRALSTLADFAGGESPGG